MNFKPLNSKEPIAHNSINISSSVKFLTGALVLAMTAIGSYSAQAITINGNFDSSITGLSNAGAVESDINALLTYYDNEITTDITVNITFSNMNSGLGASNTDFYQDTYSDYLAHLTATASSDAIDTAALAKLTSNPYTGATVDFSSANGRAVGLDTPAGEDGHVYLNTGLCFTTHNSPVGGKYDLYSITAHEVDEVLGTSSGVGGDFQDTDLFRYDGSGNRSFTSSQSVHAYFSVDGTTSIDEYNQYNRTNGDYGDWIVHNPSQVQDWRGTTGETINPGPGEIGLLDAIGYNMQAVPEPAPIAVFGLGMVALLIRRRK